MSSTQFQRLKDVDEETELLISGYNREICRTLSSCHLFKNIGSRIHSLCLLYHFYTEYFDVVGDDIARSEDKKMIIDRKSDIMKGYDNTNYGFTTIHSLDIGVFRWKLKIGDSSSDKITVGISSNNERNENFTAWRDDDTYHNYSHYGYNGYLGYKTSTDGVTKYGRHFKGGVVIDMELDLNQKQLTFYNNGVNQGIAFNIKTDLNINYRLAVSLGDYKNTVTILDFTMSVE